jgi:hypothetical protein
LLTSVQPSDNLLINAMNLEVLVSELRIALADDDIAIGEGVGIRIGHRGGADRCLLSGAKRKTSARLELFRF